MSYDVIDLSLNQPPEGWTLEQYDTHINRMVNMYKGCYLAPPDQAAFAVAEKLHEIIWVFRDSRLAKFPGVKDDWMLLEGAF